MRKLQLKSTLPFIVGALLVSTGVMSCSDAQADEPAGNPDEPVTVEGWGRVIEDREVVDGVYTFTKDTVIIQESLKQFVVDPKLDTLFVSIEKIGSNPDLNIKKDDIKVCAAYTYDLTKFGTELDPWINLDIDPAELPVTVDWLSAQIDEVNGKIGLTVSESPDAAAWTDRGVGERAIKLDILIGLNDLQCTVCSVMVIQHRSLDIESEPTNTDGFLYCFTPKSTIEIPAEGGEGAISMRYVPEGYEYYKTSGWAIPDKIQFTEMTVSEKIGDPIQEAEERDGNIYIPNDGWTVFKADRIMNSEGLCDLGWAKIRITDKPDGSKLFEYSISKNATGKKRQVRIEDWPYFRGPEYRLGRFHIPSLYWDIILVQTK